MSDWRERSGATDTDLRVMDMMLQSGIDADHDAAQAQWRRSMQTTRRAQAQRWRWMAADIADQMSKRFQPQGST